MDRREFLKKSMLLTAGAMVGGSLFPEATLSAAQSGSAAGKKKTIGLQLYSIGGDMGKDAAGSLKKISDMGYSTAETASYGDGKFYGRTPAEFRKMAEDVGIRVTGAHLGRGYDAGWEDWWKQACDAQAAVGGKYIVLPGIDFGKTEADLKRTCEYFDKVGAIANAAGLKFGYHNHAHEFNKQDGYVIENYLLEHTDPEKVMFELDVYWASKGGVNPSAYIQKYAGRFPLLHIKDDNVIGASQTIDFEAIFNAAYKQGLEAYYVEIEANDIPPMECAEKSAEYLSAAKFVK
ncbi:MULTISPECIES: sugar phosphate isomerase/epimerase family protein [unclassified Alistipes]|uniref:sugar phosphate isomerase/epimerase family protein n=1 Tax=unclassified Alistipes TaxID=2608932 RepID=UPI001E49BDCC|nr:MULTISPECIES: sugar phosphate isomerase/epimerase [unclassified Alistipes]